MNTVELKQYLANGRILTRFQTISPAAKKWLNDAVGAGEVWRTTDSFGNPRPIYAAPGCADCRFQRAGYHAD